MSRNVKLPITVLILIIPAELDLWCSRSGHLFQSLNFMEMGMAPELMYGQNVFVPATANLYQYGYAGEVNSSYSVVGSLFSVLVFCSNQFVKFRSWSTYGMVQPPELCRI
jgi:hypothetical protein